MADPDRPDQSEGESEQGWKPPRWQRQQSPRTQSIGISQSQHGCPMARNPYESTGPQRDQRRVGGIQSSRPQTVNEAPGKEKPGEERDSSTEFHSAHSRTGTKTRTPAVHFIEVGPPSYRGSTSQFTIARPPLPSPRAPQSEQALPTPQIRLPPSSHASSSLP